VLTKVSRGLCVNLGSVATFGHVVVCQPLIVCPFFNELILGWELGSTHIVNWMLMLMNLKCRLHSA
jgi:hypothetical protein